MPNLDHVVCTSCRESFRGPSAKTFLGFRKYVCTACEAKVIYPLGNVTRTIYWVVAVLFLAFAAVALFNGNVVFPGVLLFAAAYGLFRDHAIRKQVQALPQAKWR